MKRKPLKERVESLCDGYPDYALELLPSVKRAVGGAGKVYCQVHRVSQSGMGRVISVYIIHKGEIVNLDDTPYWKVYGDRKRNGEVWISGCGMDMLFEATYRLYQFLFDQRRKPYQKGLNRYRQL